MEKLIDISSYRIANVLEILLQDKTTKQNIIWATDTYEELGEGFSDKVQMNAFSLLQRPDIIRPRIQKTLCEQAQRTRKKAEVFTPAWLCNKMNNHCDEEWFGRANVFNCENADNSWTVTEGKIEFPKRKTWKQYVDSRRLEITCGEAPYLVSRYDVSTGELIIPPKKRIGMLDRKLRIVNENTDTHDEWLKWTLRAFEAVYGYEYQGDNLLIARINLLLSFADYYEKRWERKPDDNVLRKIADIIARNIWQMDGLKGTVPLGKPYYEFEQLSLLDISGEEEKPKQEAAPCKIYDWRSKVSLKFSDLKEMQTMGKKLFSYVIGNPPYQEEQISTDTEGSLKNFAPPVYNLFMDASYSVADKVELITPARFLFNAGSTPKDWNKKMLSDGHFKILHYEADSSKIFSNTVIKGGIVISYRDTTKDFGAIKIFTNYSEMNDVLKKVLNHDEYKSIDEIVFSRTSFRFTDKLHDDFPDAKNLLSKGHMYDVSSNIFQRLPFVFLDEPTDDKDYVKIIGRVGNKRVEKYICREYLNKGKNLDSYKLFIPQASGNGEFGEPLGTMILGTPNMASTETFLSIGVFSNEQCALNVEKYLKTKFARSLLGLLKVTQIGNKPVYEYVPLQDFTENSDIDWSKSVAEIDKQLYKKYGLTPEEIDFIETHVKEMS